MWHEKMSSWAGSQRDELKPMAVSVTKSANTEPGDKTQRRQDGTLSRAGAVSGLGNSRNHGDSRESLKGLHPPCSTPHTQAITGKPPARDTGAGLRSS